MSVKISCFYVYRVFVEILYLHVYVHAYVIFFPSVKHTSYWILKTVQTIKTFKQKKFWIVSLGKDLQSFLQFSNFTRDTGN